MFAKFKNFRKLFQDAVVRAPIEFIVSVVYFVFAVYTYYGDQEMDNWLWSFPMCFFFIFVINRLTRNVPLRWFYYGSVLSVPLFCWWDLQVDSPMYWVTFLVTQLLVTLAVKQSDNESFVENILCYIRDLAYAGLLAFLGWLLAWGIYWSVIYIFDIRAIEWHYTVYSSQTAFFLVVPLLFLMFNSRHNEGFTSNSFLGVLVNFILSPALLIYNLILYVYFVKIAIIWSLPKGGIAYMVLSFVALLLISKAVQPVLKRRCYDWYYNYFSFWILPSLVMLWISTLYRVGEYGWTEWRVYLMLTTFIVTVTMVLFFNTRWGKYRWVSLVSVVLLVVFTYIPGISARMLGLYSQENRVKKALELLYDQQQKKWVVATDSVTSGYYRTLYHASWYVQAEQDTAYMRKQFGFTRDELYSQIPEDVMEGIKGYKTKFHEFSFTFQEDQRADVSHFDSLYILIHYGYNKNRIRNKYEDGYLYVYNQTDTILRVDINSLFRKRLMENGMDTTGVFPGEKLEACSALFQTYDLGNKRLVLQDMQIDTENFSVTGVMPYYLLIRKE